ncbi:hypothetical protein ACMHYB_40900 [Sorangium sp. So ce1128]
MNAEKKESSRGTFLLRRSSKGSTDSAQGFVMFSRLDNMQLIAIQPKAGTPEAVVAWEHLLGGDSLAHNPGHPCGLRPARKLGNPENSA